MGEGGSRLGWIEIIGGGGRRRGNGMELNMYIWVGGCVGGWD